MRPPAGRELKENMKKTLLGVTYVDVAKTAFRKNWDFETLKYCDDTYGEDKAVVDEIYELVIECREIGSAAFDVKYDPKAAATESAANTRLIAAAPDLLAALELMMFDAQGVDIYESDASRVGLDDRVERGRTLARAAIAKVKSS